MNITMYGTAPARVLFGDETFTPCQENRIGDEQRFIDTLADPANTVTAYEATAEGIAAALEAKKSDERIWRNQELFVMDATINSIEDNAGDASAERAFRIVLRDYPQQVGFPDNARPVM